MKRSNDPAIAGSGGVQLDARALALRELLRDRSGKIDADSAREILGGTYLEYINAQAQVFVPATRECFFARGTTLRPAARQSWRRLDLARVFRAGSFADSTPEDRGSADAAPWYRDHDYVSTGLDHLLAELADPKDPIDDLERLQRYASASRLARIEYREDANGERFIASVAEQILALVDRFADKMRRSHARVDAKRTLHAIEILTERTDAPLDGPLRVKIAALEAEAEALAPRSGD